jgi:hypothetical protein
MLTPEDKAAIEAMVARVIAAERSITEAMVARVIAAERDSTNAALEHLETSLLTFFHNWTSPTDDRERALDLKIEGIAGRVGKLEAARDRLDTYSPRPTRR